MEMKQLETPLPTYDQVVSVQLEPPPYSNLLPLNLNNNGWQTQNSTGYPITSQPYYAEISDEITDDQERLHQMDGQQSQDCCGDDCCTGDYCGDCSGDDCCIDPSAAELSLNVCCLCCQIIMLILEAAK